MNLDVEQTPEECNLTAGPLRVRFRRAGDRWEHAVLVREQGDWQVRLQSLEGTAAETRPPSPAFQELRLEWISPTVAEIQLFGQSGRDVYSGAVRMGAEAGQLTFDLAARLHTFDAGHPPRSTYELSAEGLPLSEPAGESAECRLGENPRVDLQARRSRLAFVRADDKTDSGSRRIEVLANDLPTVTRSITVQWQYQVTAPAPGRLAAMT